SGLAERRAWWSFGQAIEGRAHHVFDAALDTRRAGRPRGDALEGAFDRTDHAEARVVVDGLGGDGQGERAVRHRGHAHRHGAGARSGSGIAVVAELLEAVQAAIAKTSRLLAMSPQDIMLAPWLASSPSSRAS